MLQGRRILLTGGARGLGRECARVLGRDGARIVIADILETEGQETANELKALGYDVVFTPVDLADPESVQVATNFAVKVLGGLDGLANIAAIATNVGGNNLEDIHPDAWGPVMNVNIRGTWLVSKACLPALKSSGTGRIVNFASNTALWGAPKLMHYVASKGAIIAMTRAMARELGEFGITVNAIAPGIVPVEAMDYVSQERFDFYKKGRSIKREQTPDDVASVLSFLLSESDMYMTGQTLVVDGGFVH